MIQGVFLPHVQKICFRSVRLAGNPWKILKLPVVRHASYPLTDAVVQLYSDGVIFVLLIHTRELQFRDHAIPHLCLSHLDLVSDLQQLIGEGPACLLRVAARRGRVDPAWYGYQRRRPA